MHTLTDGGGRLRRAAAAVGLAATMVVAGAAASFAATTPPDPGTVAGDLVNTAGSSMLSAIVDVLPVVVPFLVALWAIGFVWKKVRPKGGGIN